MHNAEHTSYTANAILLNNTCFADSDFSGHCILVFLRSRVGLVDAATWRWSTGAALVWWHYTVRIFLWSCCVVCSCQFSESFSSHAGVSVVKLRNTSNDRTSLIDWRINRSHRLSIDSVVRWTWPSDVNSRAEMMMMISMAISFLVWKLCSMSVGCNTIPSRHHRCYFTCCRTCHCCHYDTWRWLLDKQMSFYWCKVFIVQCCASNCSFNITDLICIKLCAINKNHSCV